MKRILTGYLKPYYLKMSIGFLVKFTGTVMDLCIPWILAYMIDTVTPRHKQKQIFLWGIVMIVCSIMAVSFNIIANRMASRVASDVMQVIRYDLYEKTIYLSERQVDNLSKPTLISRLTSDTYNLHQVIARIQRLGVRAPILLAGGIVVTMTLEPRLSAILICLMPLLALVMVIVTKRSVPMFTKLQLAVDDFVRLVREDIAGIRVIKALSKGDYERERFDEINQTVVERERKAGMTSAVINPSMNVILNLGLVLVILAGAYLVNRGETQVGKILAFMTYFTIILNAMMSISRMFVMISKGMASAERVVAVLDASDELLEEMADAEERRDSMVEFDHVSFSYNKGENNLEDISFRLNKGETLGIIGETGSGKSTIVNLLMRFYDVDQGSIWIDGQKIQTMGLEELRRKFGVVFQNDAIFAKSILENVDMGRDLDETQIQEALLYARATEFVSQKGGDIRSMLDIKGANLSGGQKQRILIARALAAHPKILILDDSSSALDYKTDAALRKEIRDHFSDTTCVIVAQRISSIMHSDHILVLEDGKAVAYGTHEELMKSCQIYQEISNSQMGAA
ncbi:ABC transporter ATP-binding protein [Clostridium sp. chh4-2]|uniref:ABC transporter ATP-binding protein n=1 Tax=Clostridium sp. chh4-2 TaxID=2067550 RepID=UPI000CCEA0A3|nr:ABC transporter ATP-binding protein [Clostridium sp. chh4-2]PNV64066.1 ABC transporter ATP-binding protein [Clostridium sp. chh4-2]